MSREVVFSGKVSSDDTSNDVELVSKSEAGGNMELRDQIQAAIEPWKTSSNKPPFSPPELIGMALVLHPEPLRPRSILKWITDTFQYFNDLMFDTVWYSKHPGREANHAVTCSNFMEDFRTAFDDYDLPIKHTEEQYAFGYGQGEFWMSHRDARLYFANRLGPERQGSFPFFRLPAELRNTIYEMVFSFPLTGLSFNTFRYRNAQRRSVEVLARTRDFWRPYTPKQWIEGPQKKVGSLQNVLNLLLVNKQIFKEAESYFFTINTFYFWKVSELNIFLRDMSRSHWRHLRHLAFAYSIGDQKLAPEVFQKLLSLEHLQVLDIFVEEIAWDGYRVPPRVPFDYFSIPGVSILRQMRGLEEVNFHGRCPTIAAALKPEMESPKEVSSSAIKRKAKKPLIGERKQPARAAKKARVSGTKWK